MSFYVTYMIFVYSFTIAFSVVAYILQGKALSAIARRRGIEKPWMAWVPVGNVWLLGCISDQYRYVVHRQETNRRTKLLWLEIGVLIAAVVVCFAAAGLAVAAEMGADDVLALSGAGVILLITFAMLAVAVVYSVFAYMAYYDLFRSCDPDKSLIFLLVSIFASYPLPFFLYICRNKDLGMPPRQQPEYITEGE